MIDMEQEVLVRLCGSNISYYREKGYDVDQYRKNNYIPQNTFILVSIKDINQNNHAKIKVICDYCGEENLVSYKSYNIHKKKSFLIKDSCKNCCTQKRFESNILRYGNKSNSIQPTIEQIREEFKLRNYILISDKYINANCKLQYICEKHSDVLLEISYNHFIHGCGCKFCGNERAANKTKLQLDFIKSEFEKANYELVTEAYKNNRQKLGYICPNHRDLGVQYIEYDRFSMGQRCRYCYLDSNIGENHHSWKFDKTQEERETERKYLDYIVWRKNIFIHDNYTCQICKQYGCQLCAHHLNGYHWCHEGRTDINNGITLCDKCHSVFHKIFGKKNNTKEQFEEFTERYKSGEFTELLTS